MFLSPTELGRICSHYYIKCETMSIFCKEMGINFEDDSALQKAYHDCKTDLSLMMIKNYFLHTKKFLLLN